MSQSNSQLWRRMGKTISRVGVCSACENWYSKRIDWIWS